MFKNISRSILGILLIFLSLSVIYFMGGCNNPTGGGGGGGSSDTTAPTVISTSPSDEATNVVRNAVITATFSEAMRPVTITAETFMLSVEVTGIAVTGEVSLSVDKKIAIFMPTSTLESYTTYDATITTGVKDLSGNALAVAKTWRFTTGPTTDSTVPTVVSTNPDDSDTDVDIDANIIVTFDEDMNPATLNTGTFLLSTEAGAYITGVVTCSGSSATFNPTSNLAYNTTYEARITTGAKDVAGNALAVDKTWSFTTRASGPTTKSITGYVYSRDWTAWTYTGMSGVMVAVSEESMGTMQSTWTNGSGYFTLTNLPVGEITVSVTKDAVTYGTTTYDLYAETVKSDSGTFNYVPESTVRFGTATIEGFLDGLSGSGHTMVLNCSQGNISGKIFDEGAPSPTFTDPGYSIFNCPDDGLVYVVAKDQTDNRTAYGKVITSPYASSECIITFEAQATIEAYVTEPAGYTLYSISVFISKNKKMLGDLVRDTTSDTHHFVYNLASPEAGDSYCVIVTCVNSSGDYFDTYFWDVQPGLNLFDCGQHIIPVTSMVKFPPDGAIFTEAPTFEWNSVAGCSYYLIAMVPSSGTTTFKWRLRTNSTKASMPQYIWDMVPSDTYYVEIMAYKFINGPTSYDQKTSSPDYYIDYELWNPTNINLIKP